MSDFILRDFLPYQLALLAERVSRDFSTLYRDRFGISITEWRVVAHLSQSGSVSVREIHRQVALEKSKVSRAATRLEKAGYITKTPHAEDGRLVSLALTPKGRDMIEEIVPLARQFEAQVLDRIGADPTCFRDAVSALLWGERGLALDAPSAASAE